MCKITAYYKVFIKPKVDSSMIHQSRAVRRRLSKHCMRNTGNNLKTVNVQEIEEVIPVGNNSKMTAKKKGDLELHHQVTGIPVKLKDVAVVENSTKNVVSLSPMVESGNTYIATAKGSKLTN